MISKRSLFAKSIILVLALKINAASFVDFYATVSSSSDTNMIRMTTDLFYTQLQSLEGYIVNDKRDIPFSEDNAISSNIAFYAEIQEDNPSGWICTLNAIKNNENKNVSATKKYSSYYKILMDAKSSLENLLYNLNSNLDSAKNSFGNSSEDFKFSQNQNNLSEEQNLDILAGTWTGEDSIEKIIITRSGRGFVIFKNGANMNVSVETSGNSVKIKQAVRSNASFFTEIPRTLALQNATSAPAIEWNLSISSQNTLEGKKQTLIEDSENPGKVKTGIIDVKWTKKF